ncbi:MAG: dienelactone hydrolase family protein [Planctomycetes bacterium]|nr:dienelactone hydrolase family protein [Planctomycetota bacterium]
MVVSIRKTTARTLLLATSILGLLFAFSNLAAPAQAGFVQRVYVDAKGKHAYQVFVPNGYTSQKQWPVVLFLHGAGERGTDGIRPTTVGLGPMIRRHPERFPFIVVFPQAEKLDGRVLSGWNAEGSDGRRALKILAAVETQFRVNPQRRILSGWSMGGHGVWSLAAAKPGLWAAVLSLSGGGDPSLAGKLKTVPVWAFHGEHDAMVSPHSTRNMVTAIRKAGGSARYTLVKGIGHATWKAVFDNSQLLKWMQNPAARIDAPSEIVATKTQRDISADRHLVPFVPAVEISRAMTVRIGNDALKTLSYSLPNMIPRDMLTGRINDMYDSTVTSGRRFDVQLSGITYSGRIANISLSGWSKDRLRVQLGLRDVVLSIARTYVTGRSRSAVAGRMNVVIGHRRPVWLTIDVKPYVSNRKIKLRLLARYFDIPNDNWYVTAPAGVSTRGFGMTRKKVSSGLVSGLYGSKGRIEREVLAMVPAIVREMESRLKIPDVSDAVERIWPLPVYAPRVRLYPESIRTDDKGVTISLGLTAAAIHPDRAPAQPRRVKGGHNSSEELRSGLNLHVAIAQNIFAPLTQLAIDAGVARIDVRDFPEPIFAKFADLKTMTGIIPDLKRLGPDVKLRTELVLREPISIDSGATRIDLIKVAGSTPLTLRIPKAVLAVSIRRPNTSKSERAKWKPYAEFSLRLSQPVTLRMESHGFTKRAVVIDLSAQPTLQVTGRFASNASPSIPELHAEKLREIALRGWKSWLQRRIAVRTPIPDIDFGTSALRISKIDASNSQLTATFTSPGTRITNNSKQTLQYEMKGPYSGWGGPYTLPPGEAHTFYLPYEMIYRRRAGDRYITYTLPTGSHSEYRAPRDGGSPHLFKAD